MEVLDRIIDKLHDRHLVMKAGEMAVDDIQGHIISGKGYDPLAPATVAS